MIDTIECLWNRWFGYYVAHTHLRAIEYRATGIAKREQQRGEGGGDDDSGSGNA